jgi:hypothetical protein
MKGCGDRTRLDSHTGFREEADQVKLDAGQPTNRLDGNPLLPLSVARRRPLATTAMGVMQTRCRLFAFDNDPAGPGSPTHGLHIYSSSLLSPCFVRLAHRRLPIRVS